MILNTTAEKNRYVTGIALSQFFYGAKALGLDSQKALKLAGLSQEHLLPSARVPESSYERVLLALILSYKDLSFGADIGQQVMPPLYGVLMSLALNSNSLGEAISYLARYQGLATGNCGDVEYAFDGKHYQLSIAMTHENPIIRRNVAECVMSIFCHLPRIITARQELSPEEICFEHAPASESARHHFEALVRCPVRWSTDCSRMILSQTTHHFPIHGHGDDLLRVAEQQAQDQLSKISSQLSALEKIKWHIIELMKSSAPRRESVAKRLNISTRTLDRRLADAGTSWQEALDQLRLQFAIDYLREDHNTVSDIAEKLGFSEIRAFQRKFKAWTGLTPSAYRKTFTSN